MRNLWNFLNVDGSFLVAESRSLEKVCGFFIAVFPMLLNCCSKPGPDFSRLRAASAFDSKVGIDSATLIFKIEIILEPTIVACIPIPMVLQYK